MNIITIKENNLHKSDYDKLRTTVRGIILNEKYEVLMLYSNLFNDYTFPGGGVKDEEDLITALKREMKEETGIVIKDIKYYYEVKEYKYSINNSDNIYLQHSYYYLVKIDKIKDINLNKREQSQQLSLIYKPILDIIKHNDKVLNDDIHQARGMQTVLKRERVILTKLLEDIKIEKI